MYYFILGEYDLEINIKNIEKKILEKSILLDEQVDELKLKINELKELYLEKLKFEYSLKIGDDIYVDNNLHGKIDNMDLDYLSFYELLSGNAKFKEFKPFLVIRGKRYLNDKKTFHKRNMFNISLKNYNLENYNLTKKSFDEYF